MTRVSRSVQRFLALGLVAGLALAVSPARAQQKVHEEYTMKILEFTTDPGEHAVAESFHTPAAEVLGGGLPVLHRHARRPCG